MNKPYRPPQKIVVRIGQHLWSIYTYDSLYGFTVQSPRTIVIIWKDPYSREFLDTVIHETLHAIYPNKSEEEVTQTARTLARVLWRYGFRLTGP